MTDIWIQFQMESIVQNIQYQQDQALSQTDSTQLR